MNRSSRFSDVITGEPSIVRALPAIVVALTLGLMGWSGSAPALAKPVVALALAPGPGRIHISFAPAHSKTAKQGKAVWQSTAVRRFVAAVNARLTLPVNLNVRFRPGDSIDAPPDRGQPMFLGYNDPGDNRQIFQLFGVLTPSGKILHPRDRGRGQRILSQAVKQFEPAIAMHELGHVFTIWWPIPTTSNNEEIADLFSAWVDVKLMHDPKALLMLANYRLALGAIDKRQLPAIAAANQAQGYQDLARLAIAQPSWRKGIQKFLPKGYLTTNWSDFLGGQFTGLKRALQPIARIPLGG